MNLEFKHFAITEMLYKITAERETASISSTEESVEQNSKGQLSIHKDLEHCILNLTTDLKTTVEGEPFRNLEISMQFYFETDFTQELEEKREEYIDQIKKKFPGEIMSFCRNQLKEVIRQLTSIDYQPPIVISNITFKIAD